MVSDGFTWPDALNTEKSVGWVRSYRYARRSTTEVTDPQCPDIPKKTHRPPITSRVEQPLLGGRGVTPKKGWKEASFREWAEEVGRLGAQTAWKPIGKRA